MDKETAIRKAKAALRRAVDDSATPAEREIALRQAKALLAKHRVDEVDVRASEIVEVSVPLDTKKRIPAWIATLFAGVTWAFGCKGYRKISYFEGASAVLVGFEPWSEIAAYSFEQLVRQGKRARKAYYDSLSKRRKVKTRTAEANAYAEGWADRVFDEILFPMHKQNAPSDEDNSALERHMEQLDLGKFKPPKSHSENQRYFGAANQGNRDGRNAVLRSGVGVDGRARSLTHQGD